MLAIIPARSGSKGVPNKNITPLHHKPLSQWSLDFASQLFSLNVVSKIIFSSDSIDYSSRVSLPVGCSFHHRSPESSSDIAPASAYVSEILKAYPGYDSFLILQPTCPFRSISNALEMFHLFKAHSASSLISVYKESYISDLVSYAPVSSIVARQFTNDNNQQIRRQDHSSRFIRNGSFYFLKTQYFHDTGNLISPEPFYFVESKINSINIDTPDDFHLAQLIASSWNQF